MRLKQITLVVTKSKGPRLREVQVSASSNKVLVSTHIINPDLN